MGARFLRLSGISDPAQHERRRSQRKPVNGSLTVSSGDGHSATAEMNDVSSLGCNLRAEAEWIRMGKIVTLSLDGSFSATGIVRWSRDELHGIEFLRPLPAATVDELEALFG